MLCPPSESAMFRNCCQIRRGMIAPIGADKKVDGRLRSFADTTNLFKTIFDLFQHVALEPHECQKRNYNWPDHRGQPDVTRMQPTYETDRPTRRLDHAPVS